MTCITIFIHLTAPASATQRQLLQPSIDKPTGTALPIRGGSLNGSTHAESCHSLSTVAEEAGQANNSHHVETKSDRKERTQSMSYEYDENAKIEPSGDTCSKVHTTKGTKRKVSGEGEREVQRIRESAKRENSPESEAQTAELSTNPDLPDNNEYDKDTSQHEKWQSQSKEKLDPEGKGSDQKQLVNISSSKQDVEDREAAEVHPEAKTKPTVGFTELPQLPSRPVSESITPAVSPDDSPLPSRRPKTLSFIIGDKYTGQLGQGNRPGSTSSSSDVLESPLFAARRRLLNQSKSNRPG